MQRCVRSHYKFDLALENNFSTPGYVTEKFFLNLEAGTETTRRTFWSQELEWETCTWLAQTQAQMHCQPSEAV